MSMVKITSEPYNNPQIELIIDFLTKNHFLPLFIYLPNQNQPNA